MWYTEMAKTSFRRRMTYKAATLAGIATNLFFGLLRAYILIAVFKAKGGPVAGYDIRDLCTYTMLTQFFISHQAMWSHVDLTQSLKTGEVVMDYCKPISIFGLYQSREMGKCTHDLFLRGLPLAIGYSIFLPVSIPSSASQWAILLLSMVLAWFISFGWRLSVGAIGFWTIETRGIGVLCFTIGMLLMGFLLPVDMLPHWLANIANHTPFPSMVQIPIDLCLGKVAPNALLATLQTQAIWAIVMTGVALLLLRAGERRLVSQGG